MNISKLSSAQSFCGTVHMDKVKIAKEIAKMQSNPQEQMDSVIGNINTLKDRLEKQTPDSSDFDLDVSVDNELIIYDAGRILGQLVTRSTSYATNIHLVVKSKSLNTSYKSDVSLGYPLSSGEFNVEADGQKIWEDGFKGVTENILRDENMSPEERERESTRKGLSDEVRAVFDRLA